MVQNHEEICLQWDIFVEHAVYSRQASCAEAQNWSLNGKNLPRNPFYAHLNQRRAEHRLTFTVGAHGGFSSIF